MSDPKIQPKSVDTVDNAGLTLVEPVDIQIGTVVTCGFVVDDAGVRNRSQEAYAKGAAKAHADA